MERHWIEQLKTIQGKIKTAGFQLQEVATFGTTEYNETITRLSEHCDKMVRTLDTLTKGEK